MFQPDCDELTMCSAWPVFQSDCVINPRKGMLPSQEQISGQKLRLGLDVLGGVAAGDILIGFSPTDGVIPYGRHVYTHRPALDVTWGVSCHSDTSRSECHQQISMPVDNKVPVCTSRPESAGSWIHMSRLTMRVHAFVGICRTGLLR
jgi:hypothetical protein